jgi:hypothetical protein
MGCIPMRSDCLESQGGKILFTRKTSGHDLQNGFDVPLNCFDIVDFVVMLGQQPLDRLDPRITKSCC